MQENQRIQELLARIYGPENGPALFRRLDAIFNKYRGQIPKPRTTGLSERDIILIVYPDQIREPNQQSLRTLNAFCEHYLTGIVSGIHLLPFYPWSSDDGFSVIDYRAVAPEYGGWDDVISLGNHFRLMFDAVINHTSVQCSWFEGFLGGNKDFADYYIEVKGNPDLSSVVRPRALPLLTKFNSVMGAKKIWTTFSADQVDLNYHNPNVLLEVLDVLLDFSRQGAQFVRLDAIAYIWKEIGTECIHLPQAHLIVQLIRAVLDEIAPHVMLIAEANVPHTQNISYLGDGSNEAQLVYNFSLPPLVLHAFDTGNAQVLAKWASDLKMPSNKVTFFNFLASHDGVGLNPLRGILPESEIAGLARKIEARGGLISYKSNADGSQSPYEVNVNFLDALFDPGEPVELTVKRFITAHAILLALAGMPGIYFHSLFGSRGWPEGVALTGRNRSVNREKLDRTTLQAQLEDGNSLRAQIFGQLSHLIRVRVNQPAFAPQAKQRVLESGSGVFGLLRTQADQSIVCLHNVSAAPSEVGVDLSHLPPGQPDNLYDLITGQKYTCGKALSLLLGSYQTVWLTNRY
jgi:glucosylglycerate phosphorylase